MTDVFYLGGSWWAVWRGYAAGISFNSKGAALAYIETCNKAGKLRA